MRPLVVLALAAIAGLAFRVELARDANGFVPYLDFPISSLLGTLSTAVGIRLAIPVPRRPKAAELRTLLGLFAIGTVAFACGRWGLLTFYGAFASRFPVPRLGLGLAFGASVVALAVGTFVASLGYARFLRREGFPLRRGVAETGFGVALLAVLPLTHLLVGLGGGHTDLPNLVVSGVPASTTVVVLALAARLGFDRRRWHELESVWTPPAPLDGLQRFVIAVVAVFVSIPIAVAAMSSWAAERDRDLVRALEREPWRGTYLVASTEASVCLWAPAPMPRYWRTPRAGDRSEIESCHLGDRCFAECADALASPHAALPVPSGAWRLGFGARDAIVRTRSGFAIASFGARFEPSTAGSVLELPWRGAHPDDRPVEDASSGRFAPTVPGGRLDCVVRDGVPPDRCVAPHVVPGRFGGVVVIDGASTSLVAIGPTPADDTRLALGAPASMARLACRSSEESVAVVVEGPTTSRVVPCDATTGSCDATRAIDRELTYEDMRCFPDGIATIGRATSSSGRDGPIAICTTSFADRTRRCAELDGIVRPRELSDTRIDRILHDWAPLDLTRAFVAIDGTPRIVHLSRRD